MLWSRKPRELLDVKAWRREVLAAEAHSGPVQRLRVQMDEADSGLAAWITGHRFLVPAAVESGESGMALLILWEVDHQRAYPGHGGEGLSGALAGFTRRLQDRVARDPDLSQWLEWKDVQGRLAAGLAESHHRRWAVRVLAR